MKTAKPPAQSDAASSSRRAQPVRQTRANPPRSSGLARSLPSAAAAAAAATPRDQPIEIYPALTHFTDAITSLPKELVRQFTLLKEVDAKIFAPEEALFQMVDAAMIASAPEPQAQSQTQTQSQAPSREAGASTPISTNPSLNGQPSNGVTSAPSADDANSQQAAYAQENIHRRHLFRGVAFKIQEMLVSLEEKNHVITTANDALSKQLARVNDVWPHLEGEFSDEAKWGSTTHWAYPENRVSARNTQAERSRRDGAATITAAAQQLADEAAARSDARKQAVAAKKGLKGQAQNQANDHDHDDHETPNTKSKPDTKKSQAAAAKARKAADSSAAVGLGITSGTPQTNGNGSKKSKKSEANKTTGPAAAATATPAIGGQPMERAMSGVMASNGSTKAKTSSPRSTPAPETKKRKALPTTNGASKKSKTALSTTAMSPSLAASPNQATFPETKAPAQPSPVPTPAARPASSRARGNSIHSTAENARQRPTSSASHKHTGSTATAADTTAAQGSAKASNDNKPSNKEPPTTAAATPATIKTEVTKDEPIQAPARAGSANANGKKETPAKPEDDSPKTDGAPAGSTTTTVVTTKSGRASKPSTPALGGFPESAPRARNARSANNATTHNASTSASAAAAAAAAAAKLATPAKRSHKKGAAAALAAQVAQAQRAAAAAAAAENEDGGSMPEDEDADEPRYCYCNGVSYGEMVACDADTCEREWFHLECVGLKAAPGEDSKWYCDNCKDKSKTSKKSNGR